MRRMGCRGRGDCLAAPSPQPQPDQAGAGNRGRLQRERRARARRAAGAAAPFPSSTSTCPRGRCWASTFPPRRLPFCRTARRGWRVSWRAMRKPCPSRMRFSASSPTSNRRIIIPTVSLSIVRCSATTGTGRPFLIYGRLPGPPAGRLPALLASSGTVCERDRDITPNVLRSCDEPASRHREVFARPGDSGALADFLGEQGSRVYNDMLTGTATYRIFRLRKAV